MIDKLYKLKQQQINQQVLLKQQSLSKMNEIEIELQNTNHAFHTATLDIMGAISDFRVLQIHKDTMKEHMIKLNQKKMKLKQQIEYYDSIILSLNKESEQFNYILQENKKIALKKSQKLEELVAAEDELNEFYEIKELEYQKNKSELEKLQKDIKDSERIILDTKKSNQKILDEINHVITSKAMLMYDKMKLGIVINVFNEMIRNGEIDEVFDIMIRMKEKRVMKILKKFDTKTSTILMKKMRINKEKNKI